jgi:hypothetical protein
MSFRYFLLIFLLFLTIFMAYAAGEFWKRKIDARKSTGHFFLLVLVNLLSVFALVFIFALVIINARGFFFK